MSVLLMCLIGAVFLTWAVCKVDDALGDDWLDQSDKR